MARAPTADDRTRPCHASGAAASLAVVGETLFTIGHSTHSFDALCALLTQHGVTAVGDVRSTPHSRRNPQFNREAFQRDLAARGIAYLFLGAELGARSDDPHCYLDGRVQYDRLAATGSFRHGLARVRREAAHHRLALLCAESDPLQCHRTLLVSRRLADAGFDVVHILKDGETEDHAALEERLLRSHHLEEGDLFTPREERLREAYALQEARIAYVRDEDTSRSSG